MRKSLDPHLDTASRYRVFADIEARGMSATYERWARAIADDPTVLALIDGLPTLKRQPNLVLSSARWVGVPDSTDDIAGWLAEHWPEVSAVALDHATQTNEPARCATLLPVLASIPGPLALLEVGASAGLCLFPDRYSYRYSDGTELDPPTGRSAVVIECEVARDVPLPERLPEVVWRRGIDLHPLDIADTDDVAWLDALIWPEHDDRRRRLHDAVGIVRAEPPQIDTGDLVDRIEQTIAEAPEDATLVVFHTAVLAYLPRDRRARFVELVRESRARWISAEARGIVPGIDDPDGGEAGDFVLALDSRPLAFVQPHGRAIRWSATP
ncbi:DUF2332 domain-containing protein [Agromyces atrinae]|uniref:DUF2332 domain-containing protein n=1 Tax=Agromyces atrinae TaxID=592376 RepID=UPI001F581A83|nr:DUF2332 domain-containing protein [Agromyces atrinae]MCI2958291.1 DUF2332 domain-containing protein [Agromyces atrinae]